MISRRYDLIYIHRCPRTPTRGVLVHGNWVRPCAIGRGGIGLKKSEGDGVTPVGTYAIQSGFIRRDKLPFFKAAIPLVAITPQMWWCDDASSMQYNTLMRAAPPQGHEERLMRADDLYDIVLVIGYNNAPAVRGKGSAIFMHIAREGLSPTAGCVALAKKDMLQLVKRLGTKAHIVIG